MSPPRWIPSAGCSASGSSRSPQLAMPGCWAGWAGSGPSRLVGIEGTGSYGAGLARHVTAAGIRVVEVDRSDRQDRRRQGKSDPLDAVSAARAAQSGRARGAPKGRDGAVEAIRALMVAKRSAAGERTQTINQARALILTGPDDLRARFTRHTPAALVSRAGVAAAPARRRASATPPASRCGSWAAARSSSTASSSAWTSSSSRWSPPAPRACSPCTGVGPRHRGAAAHRGRGSPRAAAPRGGLGAPVRAPPRSRRRRGKSPATGSTPAVTARPTMPCGGS